MTGSMPQRSSLSWTCLLAVLALRCATAPGRAAAARPRAAGVGRRGAGARRAGSGGRPLRARARVRAAARGGRERPGPGRRSPRRLDARRGAVPRRAGAQRRSRGGPPQPGGRAAFTATRRPTRWSKHGPRWPSIPGTRTRACSRPSCCCDWGARRRALGAGEAMRGSARAGGRARRRARSCSRAWVEPRPRSRRRAGALAIDPQLPAAHRARAEILRRAGDLEGASRRAGRRDRLGRRRDRRPAGARHRSPPRGGLWAQAARELATLAQAAPRRAEVHFARGVRRPRRAATGRRPLRAADAALALRPRYPEARLVRADALSQLGRDDEMRRELEQVSRRGAAGHGRRTRPRRTQAARADVRS